MILAVGGILTALTYLGTMANQARLSWADYLVEAKLEDGRASAEAMNAECASRNAEEFRRQRRMREAEQFANYEVSFRQMESKHRRKSQELLSRWW